MANTAKLTISLPQELIALADQIAKEKKVSRSKVVSYCLQDMADKLRVAEMTAGYQAMGNEQKRLAEMGTKIAREVLPEWK
jgi:metal-responsive CopG/Arc/MetJ family transcriptional regulator